MVPLMVPICIFIAISWTQQLTPVVTGAEGFAVRFGSLNACPEIADEAKTFEKKTL